MWGCISTNRDQQIDSADMFWQVYVLSTMITDIIGRIITYPHIRSVSAWIDIYHIEPDIETFSIKFDNRGNRIGPIPTTTQLRYCRNYEGGIVIRPYGLMIDEIVIVIHCDGSVNVSVTTDNENADCPAKDLIGAVAQVYRFISVD